VEFADRFGATVDVSTTATDAGQFLVRRRPSVDHAEFRRTVAAAVGGVDRITLDVPGGFVIVAAPLETARTLRTHSAVAHVGGVTIDPNRVRASRIERVERVETDPDS
jgi:hypothetical protein